MARLGPFHTLAAGTLLAVALGIASTQAGPTTSRPVAAGAPSTGSAAEPPDGSSEGSSKATSDVASARPAGEASDSASARTEPSAKPSAKPSAEATPADPTPKRADYAGVVRGNGGLIAITVRDGKAIAYFCDGRTEAWLKGTARDGAVALRGKRSSLTADLAGGRARGRLRVGGSSWRFTAPTVKKPSGLWRATKLVRGARVSGTWIKLPNGQQVGDVLIGGRAEAAPILRPDGTADLYGTTLRAEDVDAFFAEKAGDTSGAAR